MTEEQLQAACFQWHWNTFPHQRRMLFAINNNSADRREGNQHKAIGVVAGVSDMVYIHMGGVAFIELKVGKNGQSPEQKEFQMIAEGRLHKYYIAKTLGEFQDIIKSYNIAKQFK